MKEKNSAKINPDQAATSNSLREKRLSHCTALVVDDSQDNRLLMKLFLKREGCDADEAECGAEGVARALEGQYDVVLMDIQMPTMNGYEAMKVLKERGYTQPVLALTAHAAPEEKEKTQEAGFASHVTKPVDPDALTRAILQILAQDARKRSQSQD